MSAAARVVVVGGGLAGLTAAYRLRHPDPAAGRDAVGAGSVDVVILEAGARVGGKIRTERFDGFVVDAGPDSFLGTKPWALALAHELGLGDQLMRARSWEHRAYIRRDGRMHPLPAGLTGLVPGRPSAWLRTGSLSWRGRLRASLDYVLPGAPPATDESVASFARRRFGEEAYDWLIEPLLAGIHGGSGDHLGVRATFPALAEAERLAGSVMRGLHRTGAGPEAAGSPFVTFRDGMERLTEALSGGFGGCVRTDTAVHEIDRAPGGWTVRTRSNETLAADAVVIAVPPHDAALITRKSAPRLAGRLAGVPCASTTVVHLAFRTAAVPGSLRSAGYLNPPRSGRTVRACTWTSSKFEHRAPPGHVLMRVFLPAAAAPTDGDAAAVARAELHDALRITAPPLWVRVFRYPSGMPQYTVGHAERVEAIRDELARLPGLFLAGNALHGIGIPDTIRSATIAAANARSHVRESDRHGAHDDTARPPRLPPG